MAVFSPLFIKGISKHSPDDSPPTSDCRRRTGAFPILCVSSLMDSKDNERVLLLEEEVKSLSEELAQCQADKEFVWSLWKRLQVANPDLTQAVSLVVEREKQKAENKDRKVLEILQAKDYRIQELEQVPGELYTALETRA
ncbi:putative centlein [Triplophysa rosa]|uniref:Centlein n=1 Tax=Triplophysa rosa TaxID=992332 RepID=A0A9W7WYZ9_TRIRA|nr:putative centlein [Triplophysa rosa]